MYNSNIRYTANKNKQLLSVVGKNGNKFEHKLKMDIDPEKPKYSQNEKVIKYYSRPFDLQKFTMVQKRNYYVNPQKPPEDDRILYIMICCFLTYSYIIERPPPPPPSYS